MNLILSTPSIEYSKAVSHELWMLARPRGFSENETSQYHCGTFAHPDGTKVAIGPIDNLHSVHLSANEELFAELISAAITQEEKDDLKINIINVKGTKASMLPIIQSIPSLVNNLITREQMVIDGWFPPVEES